MGKQDRTGWQELEKRLLALSPGDEVQATTLSRETGLDRDTCETVLLALTRVDLFTANGDVFVRRRVHSLVMSAESSPTR